MQKRHFLQSVVSPNCVVTSRKACFKQDVLEDDENALEIVFVSSDRSAGDMKTYMDEAHGDWLALPHGSAGIQ